MARSDNDAAPPPRPTPTASVPAFEALLRRERGVRVVGGGGSLPRVDTVRSPSRSKPLRRSHCARDSGESSRSRSLHSASKTSSALRSPRTVPSSCPASRSMMSPPVVAAYTSSPTGSAAAARNARDIPGRVRPYRPISRSQVPSASDGVVSLRRRSAAARCSSASFAEMARRRASRVGKCRSRKHRDCGRRDHRVGEGIPRRRPKPVLR